MKWMILGAGGQLGRCLQDRLKQNGASFVALDSCALDITSARSIQRAFSEYKPDVVVNAAAYTAVDRAESEEGLAYAVNAHGPALLADACAKHGALLVHISTDYVFSGSQNTAYLETDSVVPKNVYGRSKLAGERAVLQRLPDAIILRTSWVFSEYGSNFLKTMLKLAREHEQLRVVYDQVGCPTYAGDIAVAICSLVSETNKRSDIAGIYHYSGDVAVSWHEFCRQIVMWAKLQSVITEDPIVVAIPSSDYPVAAYRPAHSVMDCSKVMRFGIKLSDWNGAIKKLVKCMKD